MSTSEPSQLRVAVNAYFVHHPLTGSGQYLTRLIAALSTAVPDCVVAAYRPESSITGLSKLYFEQLGFPRAASRSADLLHYPYWAAPLRSALPTVVTVHDLIPLLLEPYRGSALVRAYTALVARATRRATMIIADSMASKRDVVTHLHVPPDRVRVVYLAADECFQLAASASPTDVRARYGLEDPFVFYVGGLDRRKNVDRLIASFARALPLLQKPHVLAIAGDVDRGGDLFPDLRAVARANTVTSVVRFLGVVPPDDLPALYRAASLVAFPSSYEGFGLPPLEALACGAPVLCSDAGSLPEVVGDAAITASPDDGPAWTAALARLLNDDDLRGELSRRGPGQAARFTWRGAAEQTSAIYREAIARWLVAKGKGG